jgi:MoaA/NifB/PqqE/SkfB family radical SAM enzyme
MVHSRTVAFSRDATNVFFHILTGCNLRCRHCYVNPDQHGSEMVPVETIRSWLSAFADRAERANLILLGGEPTLHPGLAEAVRAAREIGFQSVTVDTNGYLFHNILDRVTPAEVDVFSFSLDGATPATNDAIRGEGVFETATAGIRAARERGFETSLIYTVSARNLHELDRMPALLAELGVGRFFIQVIGLRGNSAGAGDDLAVTRADWLSQVPSAAEAAAERGVPTIYPRVFLETEEPFACAGLCADNYFIFPNGRVYRCPLCEDFPLHGMAFENGRLVKRPPVNESDLFQLSIPEGCVMNRLIQPANLRYGPDGIPEYRVACCMVKEEVRPERPFEELTMDRFADRNS